jgi:hypothetical protein
MARGLRQAASCEDAHDMLEEPRMDMFKDKANDLMSSGVADQLKDIDFPASKDEVLRQLEQKGVPGPVIDKIRGVDTSRFENLEDLRGKAGL